MKLDRYQEAAVYNESNACLVRANVGSGKTTVLIEKIRFLQEQKGIPFQDMVILTFTNKAADEIRERLKKLEADRTADINEETVRANGTSFCGTFHGVALKMLQEVLPVQELGYTREFQVCLPEEEIALAEQLIREHSLKIKYKNRLRKRLEQNKRTDISKKQNYQDDFHKLVSLLAEEKQKQNKMTYEDLLLFATKLLKNHRDLLPDIQWLIIDEVQDCDESQLDFIRQLMTPRVRLFAVGDPNQAIYSWRGSVFNIFYRLKEMYQAEELSLPVNYRSTGMILGASRRFQESGVALAGIQADGDKISIKNHYNSFQEAEYLAEEILKLQKAQVPYEQIAVFYRLQNQSEILAKVFNRHQIPYEISQKKNIQDIPVLAWFLQILRFLGNHKDITSAISVLSNKSFGEGWTQKKASSEVLSFVHGDTFLSRSPLFQRMWEYQDEGKNYEKLWDFLDLEIYLPPTSVDYEENRRCILDLLKAMGNYESIRDFLNEITLNGMDMTHHTVQMPSVQLMTLHASKGLEFDYVFIIGVNDGLIPLYNNDEAAEEEERRLFYVGMTRARKFLELSFYTSPDRNGIYPGPGHYLSYLPEQYLSTGVRKQRNQQEAAEHLQEMKRMILEERNRRGSLPKEPEEKPEPVQNEITGKIYEHPKYGRGVILDENEDMIRIRFEDYGEKELLKAFLHN